MKRFADQCKISQKGASASQWILRKARRDLHYLRCGEEVASVVQLGSEWSKEPDPCPWRGKDEGLPDRTKPYYFFDG